VKSCSSSTGGWTYAVSVRCLRANSRRSRAFASFQSRRTVSAKLAEECAISSVERPHKKLHLHKHGNLRAYSGMRLEHVQEPARPRLLCPRLDIPRETGARELPKYGDPATRENRQARAAYPPCADMAKKCDQRYSVQRRKLAKQQLLNIGPCTSAPRGLQRVITAARRDRVRRRPWQSSTRSDANGRSRLWSPRLQARQTAR